MCIRPTSVSSGVGSTAQIRNAADQDASSGDGSSIDTSDLPPSSSGMRGNPGPVNNAMRGSEDGSPIGRQEEPDPVDPSSSSESQRSERTGSVQASDDIREAEEVREAEIPGDEATPAEQQGGGGCCKAFDRTKQVLKAGLTQAVSTALTFGTKPLIEATVLSMFSLTPVGASSLAATLTASLVGGAYAGIIHTAVSGAVSGLMNSALSANVYDVREGANAFLGELGTIDLPVMISFVGGYTARGAVGVSDQIWIEAVSKATTSIGAGAVQGMITDALRQTLSAFEMVYKEKPARDLSGEKLEFVKTTFAEKMNPFFHDRKAAGHDIIGKTVGSTLGMGLTRIIADRDLDSTASGALGMLTYLTSWFTGIHVGSLVMDRIFGGDATLNDAPGPVSVDPSGRISAEEMMEEGNISVELPSLASQTEGSDNH